MEQRQFPLWRACTLFNHAGYATDFTGFPATNIEASLKIFSFYRWGIWKLDVDIIAMFPSDFPLARHSYHTMRCSLLSDIHILNASIIRSKFPHFGILSPAGHTFIITHITIASWLSPFIFSSTLLQGLFILYSWISHFRWLQISPATVVTNI